ncbi:SusC/RagA family TonB-linked outer membrane protein [Chitinophaga arvensicola]|uniref:TonB-linked outer membrane protein, SusC/RagA family n=1 Tax=Chitinophaga arvensicola TaxID=29529 RepID=A0A1I0SB67_9BACT|nr:SusC/RagA family TonB-linked outer membrane protein [Chitinophaga arvensicola]SEW53933.1 TonB-linked outer membrane protein, SusC/RagA family [Chitinophaga arvensicola]
MNIITFGVSDRRKARLIIAVLICIYYSSPVLGIANCQIQKVTISANNIPLGLVFKKIKQQTGIIIYTNLPETEFSNQKKVSVNFRQTEINEVMVFLLNDKKELTYSLTDRHIIIFRKSDLFMKNPISLAKSDTISNSFDLSGKIVDKDGNPIPGASVKKKSDFKHGTISNAEGGFRLPDVNKGTIIVFSSIGFESKELITENRNILVQLNTHTNILDEKVVIAYGSTTKRLNTGNVGSLKAKDIEKQPVSNPLTALQGRVPGIFIEQASGLPGAGVKVRIQGVNSLASGNDPFYVVDGIPFVSQLLPTNNTIGGTSGVTGINGSPFSYINSADIESIEVLKDADATAIYGSRAANGAVLITTKKGKPGLTKVNLTFQNGWSHIQKKLDLLDTKEYLIMRHEAIKNDNTTVSPSDADLNGTWDTTRNIDWQERLIGRTAQYTDAQFNISGGNAATQYLFGAGYHKETTVFPGPFSDAKGSVHVNLNSNSPNQKIKIQFTSSYIFDDNRLPLLDLTPFAITLAPVAPEPFLPDGKINWQPNESGGTTYSQNPLVKNTVKSKNQTSNLISNAILSYEIIPGLTIKSSFGYNSLLTHEILKTPASISPPEYSSYALNVTQFVTNRISSWIIEPQIQYIKKISQGDLEIMAGATATQQNSDQESITAYGFNNELIMEDLGSAPNMFGTTLNAIYKYNAIYSRISYNWMNKYILNLSARRDGSSRFGPKSQFHNFGSIGAAWIFSQEQFFQANMPVISFGKLRGSYGTTGNDQIPDYQFLDVYSSIPVSGNPYQGALGLSPSRITNPYLQWEATKKLQFGLDLGFIKDRILFGVNYNQNRSSNQLLSTSLPGITGFSGIMANFPAVIQNTGWEITLSTINIKTNHFTWSTNFNITIPKNQMLSYQGLDKNNSIFIGRSLSVRTYFDYAGVNDTSGKYQFRDLKGNLTYTPSSPTDKTVIYNFDPKFYGGFQNNFTYKGYSLDIFFTFINRMGTDGYSYGINNAFPGSFLGGTNNQLTSVLDRWQKPGDKATHEQFSTDGFTSLTNINNSSASIVDASYIRLKNISVSWQIPDSWKKSARLQDARLFINAQNILTITKYKGLDPETTGYSLPPLRTISVGAQVTL